MAIDSEQRGSENGRRVKQITSRLLTEEEAQSLPVAAERPATLAPTANAPRPPSEEAGPVHDPTDYAERKRKATHHHIYRIAQVSTAGSFVLAGAALLLSIFPEDTFLAQGLGGSAIAFSAIALSMAGRTRLSSRVRGYAVASLVLAVIAFGAGLLSSQLAESPDVDEPVRTKSRR